VNKINLKVPAGYLVLSPELLNDLKRYAVNAERRRINDKLKALVVANGSHRTLTNYKGHVGFMTADDFVSIESLLA
jgi:hypothetical protein